MKIRNGDEPAYRIRDHKTSRTISAEWLGHDKEDFHDDGEEFLVTTVSYNIGGMNFATYKDEWRGYYVSVSPETQGETFTRFTMFSGIKAFIEPAARFNAKRLAEIVPDADLVARLREHVLAKRKAEQDKREVERQMRGIGRQAV